MGFKCGIVGLPNVGKSTLFNALTAAEIDASNYPFCTIEPNVGVVAVPDPRMKQLAAIVSPEKIIPTTIKFVDIAGLVEGASKGEGLGNQFLANIREVDAIAHVVRCFENPDVTHVAGEIDPIRDIEIIHTELALADLETVTKALHKAEKLAKSGDKQVRANVACFISLEQRLNEGLSVRAMDLSDEEIEIIKPLFLLTAKPVLYIANVAEDGFENNPHLDAVMAYAKKENADIVAICAAYESEIATLSDNEKQEFLHELGWEEPGLNRVIRAGYHLLNLHTFFTAGPKEVRAWTVTRGSNAQQAAGVIHTDFARGFIRAEVIGFHDYVACHGEHGAKEKGKLRIEGKDYIVVDGDVMHFRFNV